MVDRPNSSNLFDSNKHEPAMAGPPPPLSLPPALSPVHGRVLVVAAAPRETAAVSEAFGHPGPAADWERVEVAPGWSVVRSGVGKVNAALCVARCLGADGESGTLVVNLGVCGSLPHARGESMDPGTVVVASKSVYVDEGVAAPEHFTDMGAIGFPYWPGANFDRRECSAIVGEPGLVERVRGVLTAALGDVVSVGTIATLSTCSGTDELARAVSMRSGAAAEAMEGAAIGHALMRLRPQAPGFLEVRVVSNTTGDRDKQVWDLKGALATLTRVTTALRGAGA